jgi:hypothetical protein
MQSKNIYNESWKIPAARQQFSVGGSISVTAHPRNLEGTLQLFLKTHNTHKRYTSMSQAGFDPQSRQASGHRPTP